MNLSVKARIAVVITLVVASNVLAGAVSAALYSKASSSAAVARAAADRSRKASIASERVTEFLGGGTDLALAVSRQTPSEERSQLYGAVEGEDQAVQLALRALGSSLPATTAAQIDQDWQSVRLDVYTWVNREAELGKADFRITRDAASNYRASVQTNITPSPTLATMTGEVLRLTVRSEAERFKASTLGDVVRQADLDAQVSAAVEAEVRSMAQRGSLLLVIACAVFALLLGIWLYRSIARPLTAARVYADRVAHGDYEAQLAVHTDDEIGVLTTAVANMKDGLVHDMSVMREMAGAVIFTAEGVRSAAEQTSEAFEAEELRVDDVRAGLKDVQAQAGVLMELAGELLAQ